jgi:uncharacterized protein (DUF433 family)
MTPPKNGWINWPIKTMLAEPAIMSLLQLMKLKTMQERIFSDPAIQFGKPCIVGTTILVQTIVELLEEGLSFPQIIADYYPELTVDDIHACMHYPLDPA